MRNGISLQKRAEILAGNIRGVQEQAHHHTAAATTAAPLTAVVPRQVPLPDLVHPPTTRRLDDKGRVAAIVIPERLDAHRLIEEMMIQANVAAAETLEQHAAEIEARGFVELKLPGKYRFVRVLNKRAKRELRLRDIIRGKAHK